MIFSTAKSDYFINRARESCLSTPEDLPYDAPGIVADNYFSSKFIDAYIMGTTALEAFINERITINLQIIDKKIEAKSADAVELNTKKILEMLIEQELVAKYRLMPILLWQKSFDESRNPFQDFISLVSIRNDIIHYKMPFYDEFNKKPKWVRKLEEKRIFLPYPVTHPQFRVWIDEICTLKGAKWAYNTSCRMIKKLAGLAEGEIKYSCQEYVEYIDEL